MDGLLLTIKIRVIFNTLQNVFLISSKRHIKYLFLGYYRVNYDEENWKRLAKLLKGSEFEKINVLNRAQIVDDSLNLAKNGRISYDLALDILDYLHQETDYVVWRAAEEDLTFLDNMLSGTKVYNKYKVNCLKITSSLLDIFKKLYHF